MEDLKFILISGIIHIFNIFIALSLSSIIHELGHLIPMLLLTEYKEVILNLGLVKNEKKDLKFTFKLGKLIINVFPYPLISSYLSGHCCFTNTKKQGEYILWKDLIIYLIAPLFNLIATYFFFMKHLNFKMDYINLNHIEIFIDSFFWYCFLGNLFLFFVVYGDLYRIWGIITHKIFGISGYVSMQKFIYLWDSGKLEEASILLESIYKSEKKISNFYLEKFYIFGIFIAFEMKNYEKVIEINNLEKIIKDKNILVRIVSISLIKTGKFSEAIKQIEENLEKIPNDKEHSIQLPLLSLCYSQLKNYQKALEIIEKALIITPDDLSNVQSKLYYLIQLGRFEESIEISNNLLKIDNKLSEVWNNLGLAKIKSGNLEEGFQDVSKAIELGGSSVGKFGSLGIYYFLKNDFIKAKEMFNKAKELEPYMTDFDEYINQIY